MYRANIAEPVIKNQGLDGDCLFSGARLFLGINIPCNVQPTYVSDRLGEA